MNAYLVLLRGVNVGKGNRVSMAEFKTLLQALGHQHVHTLLNSGNAIFQADPAPEAELAQAVAHELNSRLGINTPVIVKTRAALEKIIKHNPLAVPEADHSRFLVAFGQDQSAIQALQPLLSLNGENEQLVLTEHAAYLHCKAGLLESALGKAMVGKAGRGVTTRNWATVLKIAALFG